MRLTLLIVGILLIVVGLLILLYKRNFYQKAHKAIGIVTKPQHREVPIGRMMGVRYIPAVRFQTDRGELIALPNDTLKPGKEILVFYDPDKPHTRVQLRRPLRFDVWMVPALCCSLGIALFIGGMVLRMR